MRPAALFHFRVSCCRTSTAGQQRHDGVGVIVGFNPDHPRLARTALTSSAILATVGSGQALFAMDRRGRCVGNAKQQAIRASGSDRVNDVPMDVERR